MSLLNHNKLLNFSISILDLQHNSPKTLSKISVQIIMYFMLSFYS